MKPDVKVAFGLNFWITEDLVYEVVSKVMYDLGRALVAVSWPPSTLFLCTGEIAF